MKLFNDFFKLIDYQENNYTISFNPSHFIYQAHFPNNPITPGVCIIQIFKELFEFQTNEKFILRKIKNLKFLAPINPQEIENVNISFSKIEKMEKGYRFSALAHNNTTQFAKISAEIETI
jgi:3-hydroxyacyl-[acyl-carrier-protein] dehydratase